MATNFRRQIVGMYLVEVAVRMAFNFVIIVVGRVWHYTGQP